LHQSFNSTSSQLRLAVNVPPDRLFPDEHANDLVHWQTELVTADADSAAPRVRAAKVPFVSPGVVHLEDAALGFHEAFTLRDPDGHVMQLIERQ